VERWHLTRGAHVHIERLRHHHEELRITNARLVRDFVVWVRFNDGSEGEVDLSGELDGPVFEPLKDPKVFAQFKLDLDVHALVWPSGADLAREFLHEQARVPAMPT
jgi:hypothetical protein